MFDFSFGEVGLTFLLAVLLLGPKELPQAMRTLGRFTRQARKLAGEFQGHVNDLIREAELDDVKNSVQRITNVSVSSEVGKLLDPSGDFAAELAKTEAEMKVALQNLPPPAATPAASPEAPAALAAPEPTPPPAPHAPSHVQEGTS